MKTVAFTCMLTVALFFSFVFARPTTAQELEPAPDIFVPRTHIVISGDTLSQLAADYSVALTDLMALNQLDSHTIYVGQALVIPSADEQYTFIHHVVTYGDTLSQIAWRYDVMMAELLAYNDIYDANTLYVGQLIYIPANSIGTAGPVTTTIATTPTIIASIEPKRIVVDLSDQMTYLYEGNTLVDQFVVSTGQAGRETITGTFYIQNKIPVAYGYTWNLKMPSWLGIYWAGELQNGFHALPILPDGTRLWEGYLGTPSSYGCVVLSQADSDVLYAWAEVGTEVLIQE